MRGIARVFAVGSQSASYLLGGLALITAIAVAVTAKDTLAVAHWALNVLGTGFLVLLASLIFVTLFGLVRMLRFRSTPGDRDFWYEVGTQAANGVTTLALTFTLLGISLGIGSLAGQTLTPETVQSVIRDLTANFSLAFMTTVIGLPISVFLRAVLAIARGRIILDLEKRSVQ